MSPLLLQYHKERYLDDRADFSISSPQRRYLVLTPVSDFENGIRKAMAGKKGLKKPATGRALATLWSVLQDGTLVASVKQDRGKLIGAHVLPLQYLNLISFHDGHQSNFNLTWLFPTTPGKRGSPATPRLLFKRGQRLKAKLR